MSDQAFAGPKWSWVIKSGTGACDSLRISAFRWNWWDVSNGCIGSTARTPWGAFLSFRRFQRERVSK